MSSNVSSNFQEDMPGHCQLRLHITIIDHFELFPFEYKNVCGNYPYQVTFVQGSHIPIASFLLQWSVSSNIRKLWTYSSGILKEKESSLSNNIYNSWSNCLSVCSLNKSFLNKSQIVEIILKFDLHYYKWNWIQNTQWREV